MLSYVSNVQVFLLAKVCRAMLLRGVDEAALQSRFGDLAYSVSLDVRV